MYNLAKLITPFATKRTFKERSVLLYQGEAPRMAYVIKSGIVKMYTINNAGEEQVIAFLEANDFFPTTWALGKTQITLYYYETLTDCEILTVSREKLSETIYKPANLQHTVDYLVSGYSGMLMRITALEQSRASEKIMLTLYYLLFRYGHRTGSDLYAIKLPLTHQMIASLVGLTRETTSTEISKLKRQKVLRYKGRSYLLDKHRLERMLGEDSFRGFSA